MGATNRPSDINIAFPDRFQQRILFDLPNEDQKVHMILKGLEEG